MKKMRVTAAALCLIGLGMVSFQATGGYDDPREKWGDDPMANPEFLAVWGESMTPAEQHKELAQAAGSWDVDTVMWMAPGGEPQRSKATAESKMVLGGRYLLEEFKCEMMGMPFEGMLLLGYDKLAGEYVSIWMDNMSCWPSIARGNKNEKGENVLVGKMHDVLTPQGRPYKHVSLSRGPDEAFVRMYDTMPDGTEWVVMEMTYKRKQK